MLKMFESRNKKISDIIKLGDYLGYSLRENVQVFSVEGIENKVTYLTENNYIVQGNYSIKKGSYLLDNINIQEANVFTDEEKLDSGIKNQVSLFLEDLYNDNYRDAEESFTDIIDIFTSRAHYQNTFDKLQKKSAIFNEANSIVDTDEYGRFIEVIPELVTFLSENKESILDQIPEISNSLKLSESVAKAFNSPHQTIDDLKSSGKFEFIDNSSKSIYEMICKQELVKKEILEAKNYFDVVWAGEPVIDNLSSKVFATDDEVEVALTEALKELPYLALVSKKKLYETFSRNLGSSSDHISEKDLKSYVSRLFEMKKPAKEQLTELLGQKYGVNLQYLKESYSFKSLINTQFVLFESIARIAPKNSVLKQVISEFSSYIKGKTGVQSIDMNNIIQQVFQHAGFSSEELPLMESFSFNEVKKAFEKADILVERVSTIEKGEPEVTDAKETEEEAPEEAQETDDKEDEGDSGEVQEKEVDKDSPEAMSDEEVMKAIKSISDIVSGDAIENGDED
tara:strand:- start:1866 stop:3398 length:1533 start_codon:yes stop_codon:yes gene_type:complete